MRAAFQPAVRGTGSPVMRTMKGQVHFEWQMEVDRAGQEGKYTEGEAHQETQKIKIRPGHGTPRAHFVRELEFETQTLLGATSTLPGSTPLRCGEQQMAADDRCPS